MPDFRVRDSIVSRDVTVWHLLTHSGGWEGQVSGPDRGSETLKNFVATTLPDLMQVAPPGEGVELQQRGLQHRRPRHRGRDGHVDQSRHPRSCVPAVRLGARRNDARRLHRQSIRGRSFDARWEDNIAASVLAIGECHSGRCRPLHHRPARRMRASTWATARPRMANVCSNENRSS